MEEYVPMDTSKIKQSKIRTEKDLEKEILEVCRILKDTTTSDWKDRVKAMETIQSIALTDRCTELPTFLKLVEKLVRPLTNQLMDLRSAVTKEASNTVRVMVQTLGEDFKSLATKFMHSSALFKLVCSATKIISEHGHLCCLAIVNY
jgi:CLASP N terminal